MLDESIKVLLIEDSDQDARLAIDNVSLVDPAGLFQFQRVRTLQAGCEALGQERFDCVLLDLNLPDGRGVGNVEAVAQAAPDVTIVVMTGLSDEATAIAALKLGAQEYVAKDKYDGESLVRIVRHAMQRNTLLRELNEQRDQEYLAASHDALTGLANRKLFEDIAERALAAAHRGRTELAFCFIDLDGFKPVNDRLGHAAGDVLLVRIADEMRAALRDADTIARVGGDEFSVVISEFSPDEDSRLQARAVANRVVERIQSIASIDGQAVQVGASVGIAMFPAHGSDLSQLLVNADMAMYAAKRDPLEQVKVYTHALRGQPGSARSLAAAVDTALTQDAFVPYYQPIWDLRAGAVSGVEVLLRWLDGTAVLAPSSFLPDVERSGQIVAIGRQVRAQALADFSHWNRTGRDWQTLALNLSAVELDAPEPAHALLAEIQAHGIEPGQLQLEFPHMALGERSEVLAEFRAAGFRVVGALGAGQEVVLATLTNAPLDAIKLDRGFIQQLRLAPDDPARKLADAMLALVQALNLPLMAVGVETDEELQRLAAAHCSHAQGHWLHPPLPRAQLEAVRVA